MPFDGPLKITFVGDMVTIKNKVFIIIIIITQSTFEQYTDTQSTVT